MMVPRSLLKLFSFSFFLLLVVCWPAAVSAQSFGFGCLGLVGGYGGYSYQNYKPSGLNNYIIDYNAFRGDSLQSPMSTFGKAVGYRVGLNLYRANLEGLIITAKGYYQNLSETHSSVVHSDQGTSNTQFEVKMKSWGVGFDLGTQVAGFVSWKVIDAALLFTTYNFESTQNFPNAVSRLDGYSSNADLGYSVGTGFILAIIDQYISFEGLIAYTVMKIETVSMDDGSPLTTTERSGEPMINFIESGGFNAVLQLNIGFPL